jgi:hypothetical protein
VNNPTEIEFVELGLKKYSIHPFINAEIAILFLKIKNTNFLAMIGSLYLTPKTEGNKGVLGR